MSNKKPPLNLNENSELPFTIEEIKLCKTLEEGLKFSCQMCGVCCRGFKQGEVYLYLDDIKRLAEILKLKGNGGLRKFAKKYLKITSDSFMWKEPGTLKRKRYYYKTIGFKFIGDDEHCEFLGENNKCSIYEAAPFQCHSFPWWRMHIDHPKNLREYSKKCLGLNASFKGEGKYISPEKILEWAIKEYEMEKEYFLKMKKNDFNIFKVYPFLPKDLPTDDED